MIGFLCVQSFAGFCLFFLLIEERGVIKKHTAFPIHGVQKAYYRIVTLRSVWLGHKLR